MGDHHEDASRIPKIRRGTVAAALHEQIVARRAIADQVISLAHLLGRRVATRPEPESATSATSWSVGTRASRTRR